MGIKTQIEWADSTQNLMMGCDGCELWSRTRGGTCYAADIIRRYAGRRGYPPAFDRPTVFPARLGAMLRWPDLTGTERPDKPWLNGYPRIVFLNDMGDTWTESLPLDWLDPYVEPMATSPHIYMILTKRARRMAAYFQRLGFVPANFWLGVTVTGRATLARWRTLQAVPDATRFLSVEPLLEDLGQLDLSGLGAVLVGAESGSGARRMEPAWVDNVFDAARVAGINFFFKQWGKLANNPDPADPTARKNGGISKGGAQYRGRTWREMPPIRKSSEKKLIDK